MALTLSPRKDRYSGKELYYKVIPINYSPVWIASASPGPIEIHKNSRVYFHKGLVWAAQAYEPCAGAFFRSVRA